MALDGKKLVLFDGVCNVCNALILFVIDRDPEEQFVFAALSSELGQRVLQEHGIEDLESVVLVENGQAYSRSTAILRILTRLRGPWFLLWAGFVLPRGLRDVLYRWFARHRYAWFGKSEQCRVPTPELRRRFVDQAVPPT
jgi:predicted DCC family thiol-disulfide oxidoreductase YuxK